MTTTSTESAPVRTSRPSIKRIVEAQRAVWMRVGLSEDLAGETCWACCLSEEGWRPERAHIVAKRHGGSVEPSNFFLLCASCHCDQPDGAPPAWQLEWLLTHSTFTDDFFAVFQTLVDWGEQTFGDDWGNVIEAYHETGRAPVAARRGGENTGNGVRASLKSGMLFVRHDLEEWARETGRLPKEAQPCQPCLPSARPWRISVWPRICSRT